MEFLKEWFSYNKMKIVAVVIVLILGVGASLYVYYHYDDIFSKKEIELISKEVNLDNNEGFEEKKEEIGVVKLIVDIKGQIKNPGVYSLDVGSRIKDVINLAGGLTGNADTSVIALSKKIIDEMVIIIYSKEEVKNFIKVKEEEIKKNTECTNQNNVVNNACIDSEEKDNSSGDKKIDKVSLNDGTLEELMTLPGVGESKAKTIIEYRNNVGRFESIDDLKNVSGIGESTYEALKDYIKV